MKAREVPRRRESACPLADLLRTAGHDASHTAEYGLEGASDDVVMTGAPRDKQVVITYDADVGTTLVLGGEDLPSIVLFRDQRRRPEIGTVSAASWDRPSRR